MCGCLDKSESTSNSSQSLPEDNSNTTMKEPSQDTIESENRVSNLLELAANDDVEELKKIIEHDSSVLSEVGLWYGRKKGSRQMVLEHRTPLMVASTYSSLGVLKLILSLPGLDVNFSGVPDKSTSLHCAACGGSVHADEAVKLLLEYGADLSAMDINGLRPFDVIVVPPRLASKRASLEFLLSNDACDNGSPTFPSDPMVSPKIQSVDHSFNQPSEKKEYPIDPSFPDINDSIYASDEFRMFSFKVRPCSRAYSHDWTECPFLHPGENARRRDPRKYHYSSVPCPEFRKGTCRRGDLCEYAHGVFECWLHPAQYKTRLCKDGISCDRRVCFFAHTHDELRPLYASTSIGMNLFPASPSSISAMPPSPFSPSCMSPPGNACLNSPWSPQQPVPTLYLPGSNLHSSRLRSSLNARDMQTNDHMASFSQSWSNPDPTSLIRAVRTKTLAPSNLEEQFCSEFASSPRFSEQSNAGTFSPTHKSLLLNQFQQQQSLLAPINTTNIYSPKSDEHSLFHPSLCVSSPTRMSPRVLEPISPLSARLSTFAHHENHLRSLSSRELGATHSSLVGSPVNSWSNWGSPIEKVDWSMNNGGRDQEGRLRRSSSFELGNNGEEPDLSWVQSLVKDTSPEMTQKHDGMTPKASMDYVDHSVVGSWLEQLQLDQVVGQ